MEKEDDSLKKSDSIKGQPNNLRKSMRVSAWGDWWEEKKEINLNYIRAAEAGNLKDVNKYLDNDMMLGKGADVNFKGLHDWTALHYAAENERVEIATLLLNQPGIEVEPITSIKKTPLHLAAMRGNLEIVKALVG